MLIVELLILIIVAAIFFKLDHNGCNTEYSDIVLYLHHFVNIFANFGWLSNNRYVLYIYLASPLIVALHWFTNDNKCVLTQLHNRLCHQHEDKMFDDIFNIIALKKYNWWNRWGHYLYLGIAMSIALYKILSNPL